MSCPNISKPLAPKYFSTKSVLVPTPSVEDTNIGSLIFDDPHNYSRFQENVCYSKAFKDKNKLWSQFVFEPKVGQCVIFPASQDHNVETNQTDEERISVSFNIVLDIDFNSATIGRQIKK